MSESMSADLAAQFVVAGERLYADPAGALYWPRMSVLVVADLHLEKGAAYAARGVPLPPYDTPDTLDLVERLIDHYEPETVVALGDSFHRADSHERLADKMRARLIALSDARRWIWISGNHDPAPPTGLGGEWKALLELGSLTFRHEPRPGSGGGEIAGHLHPVARIRARGRVLRRRCFAVSAERVVMPALGAYAGGLNVLDPAFSFTFPDRCFHAWMLGARCIYPMASARLIADPGAPLQRRAG